MLIKKANTKKTLLINYPMEIISYKEEDLLACGKTTLCKVYSIHVKVNDIKSRANDMIKIISDNSWLSKLNAIDEKSFTVRAERTIKKLVEDIFEKVENIVSAEFGEYLISDTAATALTNVYNHIKYPLAELWKEKVTGNPGFDFHTESSTEYVFFGEAKYNSSINPYTDAMTQIKDFKDLKKDDSELTDLQKFATSNAIQNAMDNKKGYIIAFSLNSKNPDIIFKNAIESVNIDCLLDCPELYLIAIEV